MDPELRRRFAKLESANKRVSIENRRLAREVIDLDARLAKLEASVPEAAKLEAKLTKVRPGPATAKRSKATSARLR